MVLSGPEQVEAYNAVAQAIRDGALVRAVTQACAACNRQAALWRHRNGYDEAHWFDVEALCGACHTRAHQRGYWMKGRVGPGEVFEWTPDARPGEPEAKT